MERIKLISEEEKKRVAYPEKQKNLFVRPDSKLTTDIGIYAIPSTEGILCEIPKGIRLIRNYAKQVSVEIKGGIIGSFTKADLSSDFLGFWGGEDEVINLQQGLYIAYAPNGITLNKAENVEQDEPLIPQEYVKFTKTDIENYVKYIRFRLYNDNYVVMHFTSCGYLPLFLEENADYIDIKGNFKKCSTYNSKSKFKAFFEDPDKYIVALVPILAMDFFSPSNKLLFDNNNIKSFTLDDINNF